MEIAQAIASLRRATPAVDDQILHRVWGSDGYDDRHLDPGELSAWVHLNVNWLLGALLDPAEDPETVPGFDEIAGRAHEIGARRALQGVGIDAVIGSWRTAERLIEQRLVGLGDAVASDDVLAAVVRLGVLVGALTDRSVRGYRQVQQEVTSHYDRLTIDLVARIVSSAGVPADEVQQRASVVGADAEADYLAVAIGVGPLSDERDVLQAQREILGVIGMRLAGRVLIGSLDDQPLLLVPTTRESVSRLPALLRSAARTGTARQGGPVVGLAAGTSRLAACHDAAHQARLALEVGLRLGRYGEVVAYQQVAVEALMLRSPGTTALLVEQLAPIRQRPELLTTLRVWLECGQSAREAARRLYVHPNTVPHRLRTIARLLDRPLNDGEDLLDLQLALRALDLGRPQQPAERGR